MTSDRKSNQTFTATIQHKPSNASLPTRFFRNRNDRMTSTKSWMQGLIGFFVGIAAYTWATGSDLSLITIAAFTGTYLLIWFGIQRAQGTGDRTSGDAKGGDAKGGDGEPSRRSS